MSINNLIFTGYVKRANFKPPGDGRTYASMSMLVELPPLEVQIAGRGRTMIGNQSMYVEITPPQYKQQLDMRKINEFTSAVEAGAQSLFVFNGTFNTYLSKQKNVLVSQIKVPFREFRVGRVPVAPMNIGIIQGKVLDQDQSLCWMHVEDRYRNPSAKKKEDEWKSRAVPVWVPSGAPSCVGHEVLVLGQLSTQALILEASGHHLEPFLHVITTELRACPA